MQFKNVDHIKVDLEGSRHLGTAGEEQALVNNIDYPIAGETIER